MAGVLSDQFKGQLNLKTKTVGEDRIRRAKERNEDVAILSMDLPGAKTEFFCCLGDDCLIGNPRELSLGVCDFFNKVENFMSINELLFRTRYHFVSPTHYDNLTLQFFLKLKNY